MKQKKPTKDKRPICQVCGRGRIRDKDNRCDNCGSLIIHGDYIAISTLSD